MTAFVHSAFLGLLGLVAIPIIIHLIRAHPFVPAEIGTLRFLREALRQTLARRRLSAWLLLLLRVLSVITAVLLFARPYLPGNGEAPANEWIVLVDASGSMNARSGNVSHFALAARRAARLATEAAEGEDVHVWLCGEEMREATARELKQGMDNVLPAGKVDWSKALRRATGPSDTPALARRVLILTDRQRADLPANPTASPVNWSTQTSVQVECLVRGEWNGEVVSAAWTTDAAAGRGAELAIELAMHGAPPPVRELALEIWIGKQCVVKKPVPAVSGTLNVSVPTQTNAGQLAEIRLITHDCLPEDDRLWLPQWTSAPMPVWLVAAGAARGKYDRASYFLEKALEVIPSGGQAVFAPRPAHAAGAAFRPDAEGARQDPNAVVLCDYGPEDVPALSSLADLVEAGAGLIIFLGPRADASSCAALQKAGLLPAAPALRKDGEAAAVAWWDVSHPVLCRYRLDRDELASLQILPRHDLSPLLKANATALARLADDSTWMVETACGKGRVIVVAARPTRDDSDWVIQRAFAPLVRELASFVGTQALRADGWRVTDRRFTDAAGFGPQPGGKRILRFPVGEGDLVAADDEQFRAALHLPDRQPAVLTARPTPRPADATRKNEWWPRLSLALLGLMVTEILVADRRII